MTLHPMADRYRHLFEREHRFVFLVSHMRSYSSLLGHLLAETSEVDGYSELHRTYEDELDLLAMAIAVQQTYDEPIGGSILFDKILHRGYTIAPDLLQRPDVTVILGCRSPQATLSSLVTLGTRDPTVKWAADPSRALQHYTRRLDDMKALAEHMPAGSLLITDALIEDQTNTLTQLASAIGLTESIPSSYSLHPRTGVRKYGDSSDSIRHGSIREQPTPALELPPGVMESAHGAFDAFLRHGSIRRLDRIGRISTD